MTERESANQIPESDAELVDPDGEAVSTYTNVIAIEYAGTLVRLLCNHGCRRVVLHLAPGWSLSIIELTPSAWQ